MQREVAGRWLAALDPEMVNSYWELNCVPSPAAPPTVDASFQARLLDNMYDAVVFVDVAGQIKLWNHGAERLTRHRRQQRLPAAMDPGDAQHGRREGPGGRRRRLPRAGGVAVRRAIAAAADDLRAHRPARRGRQPTPFRCSAPTAPSHGAILLLHDASSETSLEQRCQSLHEKATRDPLTQVANRAEFDRVHELFVEAHQQQQVPCSLIMCDLDHFKSVNDTYGHQAGDEAIKSLATLLKGACRPGDLVARYGGEEFVMLCADCDNAAAARRAEQVRIGAGPDAAAEDGGPHDHRQLRRDRDPAGRHRRKPCSAAPTAHC